MGAGGGVMTFSTVINRGRQAERGGRNVCVQAGGLQVSGQRREEAMRPQTGLPQTMIVSRPPHHVFMLSNCDRGWKDCNSSTITYRCTERQKAQYRTQQTSQKCVISFYHYQ